MTEEKQHALYREAGEQLAPAIARLARAMERDADKARDLEQDIHCEIFRSLTQFQGQCALKTWVYRVAHNVAAEHRLRESRGKTMVTLDHAGDLPAASDTELETSEGLALIRAQALIRQLPTLDAQIMLLWLEGESAKEISDVTGLASGTVATRIHRLKASLADHFVDTLDQEQTP